MRLADLECLRLFWPKVVLAEGVIARASVAIRAEPSTIAVFTVTEGPITIPTMIRNPVVQGLTITVGIIVLGSAGVLALSAAIVLDVAVKEEL